MLEWENGERFVNPYNFVPFGDKLLHVAEHGIETMTGYIQCNLTVVTPLFIPNTSNKQALHDRTDKEIPSEACSYDFFSYTDLRVEDNGHQSVKEKPSAPVIPGSEIRGAVRSVYEAAFHGCLSQVNLNRTLGRRSPKPKMPGILKKSDDGWSITCCKRLMLKPEAFQPSEDVKNVTESQKYQSWEEGKTVYVKTKINKPYIIKIEDTPQLDLTKGYLHKGEKFENKKSESVFVEETKSKIKVSLENVQWLRKVMEQYRDRKKNKQIDENNTWYPEYSVDAEKILVYYQTNDQNEPCYLSPACIGKEIFQQNLKDLLTTQSGSNVAPCENRDTPCTVCALFGMVSGNGARASRLRFGDATLAPAETKIEGYASYYLNPTTLPEMGEPKPSAVEFYTMPSAVKKGDSYGYWTYDYQMGSGRKRNPFTKEKPLKLRGRKFYWHSDSWKEYVGIGSNLPTEMRQKIRPLKASTKDMPVQFTFKIYFENITKPELQQLCWALDFNDENCAHKLGRAKPLGFGSVKIGIGVVEKREINRETGKWEKNLVEEKEWRGSFAPAPTVAISELKKILNINHFSKKEGDTAPKVKVCYPKGEAKQKHSPNAAALHQWFRGNRSKAKDANGNNPLFAKVLPKITEEITIGDSDTDEKKNKDPWLYALAEKEKILRPRRNQ